MNTLPAKWYAVCTRPMCEKKLLAYLKKQNIEAYVPMRKVQSQWSIFKKDDMVPLFPSMVFVRAEEHQLEDIRKCRYVVNFLYWLSKPAVINDSDIENIQRFVSRYDNIRLNHIPLSGFGRSKLVKVEEPVKETVDAESFYTSWTSLSSLGYILIGDKKRPQEERTFTGGKMAPIYSQFGFTG